LTKSWYSHIIIITYQCGWLGTDVVSWWSTDLSYLDSGPIHVNLSIQNLTTKVIFLRNFTTPSNQNPRSPDRIPTASTRVQTMPPYISSISWR
jgi:hypothetical protein